MKTGNLMGIVAAVTLVAGCAGVKPLEVPYQGGQSLAAPVAWEEAFAQPRSVEVIPLVTGEVNVPRGLLLDLGNSHLGDRSERDEWVPVVAYLVRHPDGDILLDTGFDSSFSDSGHGNFGGLAKFVNFARQEKGRDVASLIRQAGSDPENLRMIVISHLDSDHTAGLPELPHHVPVVAGPHATEGYDSGGVAPYDHFAGIASVQTLSFEGAAENEPGQVYDLLGDGSIYAISTPGHQVGNLSFLVNGKHGPLLLTCDASHTREGFDASVGPGKTVSRQDADASVERLRAFVTAHPSVRVKAGHEAKDWDMTRGVQSTL